MAQAFWHHCPIIHKFTKVAPVAPGVDRMPSAKRLELVDIISALLILCDKLYTTIDTNDTNSICNDNNYIDCSIILIKIVEELQTIFNLYTITQTKRTLASIYNYFGKKKSNPDEKIHDKAVNSFCNRINFDMRHIGTTHKTKCLAVLKKVIDFLTMLYEIFTTYAIYLENTYPNGTNSINERSLKPWFDDLDKIYTKFISVASPVVNELTYALNKIENIKPQKKKLYPLPIKKFPPTEEILIPGTNAPKLLADSEWAINSDQSTHMEYDNNWWNTSFAIEKNERWATTNEPSTSAWWETSDDLLRYDKPWQDNYKQWATTNEPSTTVWVNDKWWKTTDEQSNNAQAKYKWWETTVDSPRYNKPWRDNYKQWPTTVDPLWYNKPWQDNYKWWATSDKPSTTAWDNDKWWATSEKPSTTAWDNDKWRATSEKPSATAWDNDKWWETIDEQSWYNKPWRDNYKQWATTNEPSTTAWDNDKW